MLSRDDILKHRRSGNIHIDPFDESLITVNSVDVRLGPDLWVMGPPPVLNPYNKDSVDRDAKWRQLEPASIREMHRWGRDWHDLPSHLQGQSLVDALYELERDGYADARGWVLRSDRFYLATTKESIGSLWLPEEKRQELIHQFDEDSPYPRTAIVPEMRSKSTAGRMGLTTAVCAGLGDVGYHWRWALEVRVAAGIEFIILLENTVIGQVTFTETKNCYVPYTGHYTGDTFLPNALKTRE